MLNIQDTYYRSGPKPNHFLTSLALPNPLNSRLNGVCHKMFIFLKAYFCGILIEFLYVHAQIVLNFHAALWMSYYNDGSESAIRISIPAFFPSLVNFATEHLHVIAGFRKIL